MQRVERLSSAKFVNEEGPLRIEASEAQTPDFFFFHFFFLVRKPLT